MGRVYAVFEWVEFFVEVVLVLCPVSFSAVVVARESF